MQNARVLKDLACANLHFAVRDVEINGDKASLAQALDHVREVEAYLSLLVVLDETETAPPAAAPKPE